MTGFMNGILSRPNPRSPKKNSGLCEMQSRGDPRFLRKLYTKVSWLAGVFSVSLPGHQAQWLYGNRIVSMTESSQSQLRDSGGIGTKVPHLTSFEIYVYTLDDETRFVNNVM